MKLDKERVPTYISILRITIILCWCSLIAFLVIKLFGGNWFEIAVSSENFIKFSNYLDNTWLKYIVSYITVYTSNYILLCSICQKFKFKGIHSLIMFILISSVWAISNFVPYGHMNFWYGYVVYIVIGIIYQKGWKRLFGLLACVLQIAFTTISIYVRNVELTMQLYQGALISLILCVDVYLMLILFYLHSNLSKIKRGIK